jgi:hypothetical protein
MRHVLRPSDSGARRTSRRPSATPTPSRKATKASSSEPELSDAGKGPVKSSRASKAAATPAKDPVEVQAPKSAAKATGAALQHAVCTLLLCPRSLFCIVGVWCLCVSSDLAMLQVSGGGMTRNSPRVTTRKVRVKSCQGKKKTK